MSEAEINLTKTHSKSVKNNSHPVEATFSESLNSFHNIHLKNKDIEEQKSQKDKCLLKVPYQFLQYKQPPLYLIFFPHFSIKTITFVMTIVFCIAFACMLGYNYSKKQQNDFTWNCSLFEMQNKYYPRLRYSYELWRIPVSGVFHSNIVHLVVNVLGLQIYGYFVEWHLGKKNFIILAITSIIVSHIMGCLLVPTSVSTESSSILYGILAIKAVFLFEYRSYKPLENRKNFIYVLWLLIFLINFIPVVFSNNVDFTCHISGLLCGLCLGIFWHLKNNNNDSMSDNKTEVVDNQNLNSLQNSEKRVNISKKLCQWMPIAILGILSICGLIVLFSIQDENQHYEILNEDIMQKCGRK